MDKLPQELLRKIFIQLDINQRLECLLVCRSWWSVLTRYALFYNVTLKENNGRFNKMTDMFKRFPNLAAQVEIIDIYLHCSTQFNKRELLNIFPNAREIEVNCDWGSGPNRTHFESNINIIHTRSKIEVLRDNHQGELVSQMLYSNLGAQLKTLFLELDDKVTEPNIVGQLKNLPVLNMLVIRGSKLSLHDIEMLHCNIPSLQGLRLRNIAIKTGDIPSNIVPATSIVILEFLAGRIKDIKTLVQFYQYMAQKYTNVTQFIYEDDELEHYSLRKRKQVYLNGILEFFKVVGVSLNKLFLHSFTDGVDIFEALETANAHIKELRLWMCRNRMFLQCLCRSSQIKYVETLCLIHTSIDSIHLIKDMAALTTLKIHDGVRRPAINLTDCLDACPPSLKNLSITSGDLVVEPFNKKLNSIETLEIGYITLTSCLGDIISSCFPNLIRLNLTGKMTEHITIALDSPHFQKAIFKTNGENNVSYPAHGFTFSWPNQIESLYYISRWKRSLRKRVIKSVPYELIQDFPMLLVTSLTEKRVRLKESIEVVQC